MRAGKIASLVLAAILTAVAALIWLAVEWSPSISNAMHTMPEGARIGLLIAGTASCFLVILVPLGAVLDNALKKLKTFVESSVANADQTPYLGPRWLAPVTRSFTSAVDQFHQSEAGHRNQLRELEIRHRVSEAERRQIEAVLHSLRDAVVVTDAFDEIVMANETAACVLGFNLDEAIHQPITGIIHDQRLVRMITDAKEAANVAERLHVEHDIAVGPSEGNTNTPTCLFDVTLACVENHKHEVGGVVTILHDLTREREVSQMKSDFVSKASHELRTPLSSIRAYVEMLVDGEAEDDAARQEFYQIIHDETERLGRLIDNMLNISRIEAGIVQIERDDVDIRQLIERVAHSLEPQALDKNLTLLQKPSPVDLCVEGDADMLYQAVLNLASNAVKYTPEGGRITLAADSDNLTRSVVVTVSDTGLGIPPDALPRLFDKFYRVQNYKRVAKGTGLGLSLCKHIVETVHHGQIGVESKLGMGSKFWFSIPMKYVGSQVAA